MSKVSVIIPSRNCRYAARTVDDIMENATGDVEVIVVLDGYWPNPPIKEYKNLIIIHKGEVAGLRKNVNLAVSIAKGKWLMKCDDHCMFGKGFDELLQEGMEDDWLANPSRYALDADNWVRGRGPTEYLFITYPYIKDNMYGNGLHGKKWIGEDGIGLNSGYQQFYWRENQRKGHKMDLHRAR